MSDFDNALKRADKLKRNIVTLVDENNRLKGKNHQLWLTVKRLSRDIEGLMSNIKIKAILEDDASEFETFLAEFKQVYDTSK